MLREVAEYPNSFAPLGPATERLETPRYTLCLGAGLTWNTVQRQRFALEELDEVLEEVRAALRERSRTQTQWEVGTSAPPGLVDALLFGEINEHEPDAPEPAVPGLHCCKRESGGNCGIDCIAACAQNRRAGFSCDSILCGDDTGARLCDGFTYVPVLDEVFEHGSDRDVPRRANDSNAGRRRRVDTRERRL